MKTGGKKIWLVWIVLVLLLAAPLPAAGDDGERRFPVRIEAHTREERTAIANLGLAIDQVGAGYVISHVTGRELADLRRRGYRVEPLAGPQDFPSADANYHNYAETVAELQQAAADHSDILQLQTLGLTRQGRAIYAVKISDNVAQDEDEPEAVFMALHHAREHLSVEMALYLLHHFTDDYGVSGSVTNLVNQRVLWIIPMVNPDGGEYDVATGAYRYWRKNLRDNDGNGQITSYDGVDLNRNYGYRWGGSGSSGWPAAETYRGPAAFSEPETQAVRDFIATRPNVKTLITFHTYGELILYPYGYTYTDVPADMTQSDHDVLVAMANAMAASNGYTPQQASDLYITSGDTTDWAYGQHGIFAFTFELYPTGYNPGFYPPDEVIPAQTARNRAACEYLAGVADNPHKVIGQGGDATPPRAAIISPGDGLSVTGTVSIVATADDDVGVTLVEFLVDGQPLGLDDAAPYTAAWDASGSLGPHTLTVRAYDAGHNTSPPASVQVVAVAAPFALYLPVVTKGYSPVIWPAAGQP